MAAEWPEIIEAGAAVVVCAGGAFAWIYSRIEKVKGDLDNAVKTDEAVHSDLYDKISNTRENYVPKTDFEKDVDRLEKRFDSGISQLSSQIQNVGNSVTSRIDALVSRINGSH